jgi:glycerophosphoryl diester phosphodiesterase
MSWLYFRRPEGFAYLCKFCLNFKGRAPTIFFSIFSCITSYKYCHRYCLMKKLFLFVLFQFSLLMVKTFGQKNELSPLYLTNYTFSAGNKVVGYVSMRGATPQSIKEVIVKGEHAQSFAISKDHQLSVTKVLPGQWALDIVLVVKTSEGTFSAPFRVVRDEFIRNKVVAHRGAWKNTGATENSIASLQHAIALGCQGSEFDVHMSADSELFIHHDPHVKEVSIARSSAAVLKELKLSNGESLPTLSDYLAAGSQQNKTKLVLEIKTSELGKESSIALTHKVVQLVEKLKMQAIVDFIAFDYDVCKEVKLLAPYARVSYLNGDKAPASLAQDNFFGIDYNLNVMLKNPGWIQEAKQNKLTVNVWTVNEQSAMESLLQQQVDFITTNEPELLLKVIGGK